MEKLSDVMKRVSKGSLGFTDDVCVKHETQVNGKSYVKEVRKITFKGKTYCPLCERDKSNDELKKQEEEKIKRYYAKKKYNVFHGQSIVTDVNLLDSSFANYEAEKGSEEEINKEKTVKAIRRYRSGEVFNTWFTGNPGVGKSHLAMTMIRNLNETDGQERSCLFVSVDSMLMKIRESFSDKESRYTEAYFVDLLSEVDFLVLDDLGAETGWMGTDKKASDFTSRVLNAIANGRRDKPTIITTNLPSKKIYEMYDPRLISRLVGTMYPIRFEKSEDKRIKELDF